MEDEALEARASRPRSDSQPTVFFQFNGRNDNHGDVLIFSCLRAELEKHADVILLGSAPEAGPEKPQRFRKALLTAARHRIVSGKRPILLDAPGGRFPALDSYEKTPAERLKRFVMKMLWRLTGCRHRVTGISIHPSSEVSGYHRYDRIGVRDEASLRLLEPAGVPVELCPDVALLRDPGPPRPRAPVERVVVSLRCRTPHNLYDEAYGDAVEKALGRLMEAKFQEIDWACFFAQVDEDQDFNRRLGQVHGVPFRLERPEGTDYNSYFSGYQVAVSNRLHVLIPAMTEGLLPVALISRDQIKIRSLFETHGLEDCILFIDEPDRLTERMQWILDNRDALRKRNHEILSMLQESARDFIQRLVSE